MTATTDHERRFPHEYRALRARERFGWTPSPRKACPRTLAGKQCTFPRGCLCCPACGADNVDHMARWQTPHGPDVITNEPYNFAPDAEEFTAWADECRSIGLSVTIYDKDESLWFPGRTTLIVLARIPHEVTGRGTQ
jgi:hypothetical protein